MTSVAGALEQEIALLQGLDTNCCLCGRPAQEQNGKCDGHTSFSLGVERAKFAMLVAAVRRITAQEAQHGH